MKNIQAIKRGCMINFSINGKLHKKNCSTPVEADELYRAIIDAKQDQTEASIRKVYALLNEKTRIAMMAGLENDPETGDVFLAGFNTPVPMTLVEVIKEYHENGYPIDAIVNFWKLLMINPDKRVRTSLFDFIQKHDFVLTDKGYMIVYKAVDIVADETVKDELPEFVSNQYLHVKKDWKCSPNKYVVYRKLTDEKDVHGELFITKIETAENWNEKEEGVEILGKLGDLFNSIYNDDTLVENPVVYTDHHSHTFKIILGETVHMERKECNSDPAVECSYGLHVGATKYVENWYKNSPAILVCYVNPANVVAVPDYDHSKMRVTEYFPFALATYKDGKIDIIEEKYFESDYQNIEQKRLERMIKKVKANELPIEKAIQAEEEVRPMSELLKILETRVFDLEVPVESGSME